MKTKIKYIIPLITATFLLPSYAQNLEKNVLLNPLINKDKELSALIEYATKNHENVKRSSLSYQNFMMQYFFNNESVKENIALNSTKSNSNDNIVSNVSLSAGLSWEIDFWGKIKNQQEISKNKVYSSFIEQFAVKKSLENQIIVAYYSYFNCRENQDVLQAIYETDKKIFLSQETKFKHGFLSENEFNVFKNNTLTSKINYEKQKNSCDYSLKDFANNISYDYDKLKVVVDKKLENKNQKLSSLTQDLKTEKIKNISAYDLLYRPDVMTALIEVKDSMELVKIAEKSNYPTISLSGNINFSENKTMGIKSNGLGWQIGPVSIVWPLLNEEQKQSQEQYYNKNFEVANISFANKYKTALNNVLLLQEKIQNNEDNIKDLYMQSAISLANYQNTEKLLKFGQVSQTNLEESKKILFSNQIALNNAFLNKIILFSDLEKEVYTVDKKELDKLKNLKELLNEKQ